MENVKIKKIKDINIILFGTNSINELSKIKNFHLGRYNKYNSSEIIQEFIDKNLEIQFDLIDFENVKVTDEIPYICLNHKDKGVQYVTLDGLRHRDNCCYYGGREKIIEKQSQSSIEDAIKICNERKYICLTKEIHNMDQQIKYICSKHKNYGVQTTTLWGLKTYTNNCKLCRQASGENHWNWQGGIGLERDAMKETFEYKNWRKSVFERDNYTCQCCGETGIRLNAHHIENYSSHPELRLEIDNGITLCENCHSINIKGSFHSVYGTKNNNKEQLDEYIKLHKNQKQVS